MARKLIRPPRARSASEVARHARAAADAFKDVRARRIPARDEGEEAGARGADARRDARSGQRTA